MLDFNIKNTDIKQTGVIQMNTKNNNRRKLIAASSIVGSSALIGQTKWAKPIIKSVFLPAHATTSCEGNQSLSGPISGSARAQLSAQNSGTITICAEGLGAASGTFINPGAISESVVNYSFAGCTGSATLNGQVSSGTASGTFTYTLTCPSGECTGSGIWQGDNTMQLPLLYLGSWSGTQTCCGEPEFVIGRDVIPFICPF